MWAWLRLELGLARASGDVWAWLIRLELGLSRAARFIWSLVGGGGYQGGGHIIDAVGMVS